MDLQTVEDKLREKDYYSDAEFESDINLIWDNALLFNQEGTEVYIMALEMKKEFERLLALPQELLFQKKQPKNPAKAKPKPGNDRPLSEQELAQLCLDIRQLSPSQIQEIYTKMQNYAEVSEENIEISLQKIPSRVVREIQKFVMQKMPLVRIQKKPKKETAPRPSLKEREEKPKQIQQINPYKENTIQTTDLPIVTVETEKDNKALNADSSDSFISDLESD